MSLFMKPNAASGVPVYQQLKEQIRHAVEMGALRPGDVLPPIRLLAEQLVVNVNTVARVYRELDADGLIELRQGVGAFISQNAGAAAEAERRVTSARSIARDFIRSLQEQGLKSEEIRRIVQIALDELLDEPVRTAGPSSSSLLSPSLVE